MSTPTKPEWARAHEKYPNDASQAGHPSTIGARPAYAQGLADMREAAEVVAEAMGDRLTALEAKLPTPAQAEAMLTALVGGATDMPLPEYDACLVKLRAIAAGGRPFVAADEDERVRVGVTSGVVRPVKITEVDELRAPGGENLRHLQMLRQTTPEEDERIRSHDKLHGLNGYPEPTGSRSRKATNGDRMMAFVLHLADEDCREGGMGGCQPDRDLVRDWCDPCRARRVLGRHPDKDHKAT